jgi:hypothetical protein
MAEPNLDAIPPTTRWNAEWSFSQIPEPEEDPDLVILMVYENYLNLVALEEALTAWREALPWAPDTSGD